MAEIRYRGIADVKGLGSLDEVWQVWPWWKQLEAKTHSFLYPAPPALAAAKLC